MTEGEENIWDSLPVQLAYNNKKIFPIKNGEYRDGIKSRRRDRDDLYLVHVELAATKMLLTFDRNEIWGRDLYQFTA